MILNKTNDSFVSAWDYKGKDVYQKMFENN
jgi:hypothetical protein